MCAYVHVNNNVEKGALRNQKIAEIKIGCAIITGAIHYETFQMQCSYFPWF